MKWSLADMSEYNHKFEKVRQTVKHGSVYEALIKDFIKVEDVLNYLLNVDINCKTMVAYRAVCSFRVDQIVSNNPNPIYNDKPFITITESDEYVGIYNLTICKDGEIYGRNDKERIEIARKCQRVWPKLMVMTLFSTNIHLICDSTHLDLRFRTEDKWLVVAARSKKIIRKLYNKLLVFADIWLDNDYLEPLNSLKYSSYEQTFLNRCHRLKKKAPLYWDNVAEYLYQEIVTKNIDINRPKLSRDMLVNYMDLFPSLFSEDLLNMSELSYNLSQLTPIVRAYVLGFPIQEYVPSDDTLEKSIKMLEEMGPDKYCDMVIEQNKKLFSDHSGLITTFNPNITVGNEEDVYTENIHNYSPFDIIKVYIDTHVYYFTRPEFPNISKTKKNIWTNKKLPMTVLATINSRIEAMMVCNLPPSAPLKTLLERTEKGTLYDTSEENGQEESGFNEEIPIAQLPPLFANNLVNDYRLDNIEGLSHAEFEALVSQMVNAELANDHYQQYGHDYAPIGLGEEGRMLVNMLMNNPEYRIPIANLHFTLDPPRNDNNADGSDIDSDIDSDENNTDTVEIDSDENSDNWTNNVD